MKTHEDDGSEPEELQSVSRLSKELRIAAETMSDEEVRYLVDRYYQLQHQRIASAGQIRSLDQGTDTGPGVHPLLDWVANNTATLERIIPTALKRYAAKHPVGGWLLAVHGIGPVIAAGLLAHIDITKCPTVGHIWAFAGLNPEKKWNKREKRPWNARLKVLCWKAGQSFLKTSGSEKSVYGKHYLHRKAIEIQKNEAGDFREQAEGKAKIVGKTTDAWKSYSIGKLSPAHIDARARRWAVKLFLAHLHDVWYREHYKAEPPLPYAIGILGHAHQISA